MSAPLGQRISIHRGSFLAGGWSWYLGAIFLLCAFYGAPSAILGLARGEESVGGACGMAAVGLLGPLLLISPVLRWRQTVEMFEHGMVWTRLYGAVTVRREEVSGVEHIYHSGRSSTYHELVVHLRDGGQLVITGINEADQIASFLRSWSHGGVAGGFANGAPIASSGWQPPQPGGWTPPAQQQQQQQGTWQPPSGSPGGWKPPGGNGPFGAG